MCLDSLYQFQFLCKCLIHSCLFCNLCNSPIKNLHIRKDQLKVDCLDITRRINRSIDVDDIGILETTHYMYNRIYLTDVGKKLVTKSFSFAGTLYESSDIYEFDGRRCHLLCMIKLTELYNSLIRNRYDTHVRVDCCKWIVGR